MDAVWPLAKVRRVSERGNRLYRGLDRYVGVPLVVSVGRFRRRRTPPTRPARIVVLKTGAIGDTILLSGPLRDLRAAFPESRVVLVTSTSNAEAGRLLDDADEVVSTPISRPWLAIRRIRAERADLLLDFASWPRIDALVSAFAGTPYTIGFATSGQHRHHAYDAVVEHSDTRHELDNYRALIVAAGARAASSPYVAPPGVLARSRIPESPFVVLHLWAAGIQKERKEWSLDRWRGLASELTRRGFTIALTGGLADVERSRAFLADGPPLGPSIDFTGTLSLPELVDLLGHSSGLVTVNTGVMHLAAAAGVPTVALNGPTSSRRWGPIGPRCVSVDSETPGCGYLNLGFEYAGRPSDCMEGVSVARVLEATLDLVDEEKGVPRSA